MKKLIGILTALTLLFLLVGCSSKSNSKYDEEINRVLVYLNENSQKFNKGIDYSRDNINIKVYNVTFNLGKEKYDGDKNIYKITYFDNKHNKIRTELYTILNDNKIKELEKDSIVIPMLQNSNIDYEELNNKELKEEF